MESKRPSVLIIYTGGTIGMVVDPETGAFHPFDFDHLYGQVPEIKRLEITLDAIAFDEPIDSSDMTPGIYENLAHLIEGHYDKYDGFVILHGSDTMAYTASALSFMLENLGKPVILTGSQLPIGIIRTDGKENLITAIEIAAARKNGVPCVPEVAIYFEYKLYRGNRTIKTSADDFEAFDSPNYPVLANAGVEINFNHRAIKPLPDGSLKVHSLPDPGIAILKLYPGIPLHIINVILKAPGLKAVVLETFGSGNAPSEPAFLKALQSATDAGLIVVNVTQCNRGNVTQGRYAASYGLTKVGIISGFDMTTEAAVTKLMFLLGKHDDPEVIRREFQSPVCGEMGFPASV